jgi:hypothetical protein
VCDVGMLCAVGPCQATCQLTDSGFCGCTMTGF